MVWVRMARAIIWDEPVDHTAMACKSNWCNSVSALIGTVGVGEL